MGIHIGFYHTHICAQICHIISNYAHFTLRIPLWMVPPDDLTDDVIHVIKAGSNVPFLLLPMDHMVSMKQKQQNNASVKVT